MRCEAKEKIPYDMQVTRTCAFPKTNLVKIKNELTNLTWYRLFTVVIKHSSYVGIEDTNQS